MTQQHQSPAHQKQLNRRVVPLEGGSNFRDLGGYQAEGGKSVRWEQIYRSGAMPMLTDKDHHYLAKLKIAAVFDLRSNEERECAPTSWPAHTPVRHLLIEYPGEAIFRRFTEVDANDARHAQAHGLYPIFPTLLQPQFKMIFESLLAGHTAFVFHCSAGQDRTGLVAGLILSALGVPRESIFADYHLSTTHRRPENEFSWDHIKRLADRNFIAKLYKETADTMGPSAFAPRPLIGGSGEPQLAAAFRTIEDKWGSIEGYLDTELGVNKAAIQKLRELYLEDAPAEAQNPEQRQE